MTQKLPLPLTAAMLRANENAGQAPLLRALAWPPTGTAATAGNDVDVAEAAHAVANSHSADVEADYDPQHQEAKGQGMVPPLRHRSATSARTTGPIRRPRRPHRHHRAPPALPVRCKP